MTDETRKRLVGLWEKKPELKPCDSIFPASTAEFGLDRGEDGWEFIPTQLVEDAAVGRLVRWLGRKTTFYCNNDERYPTIGVPNGKFMRHIDGPTLLDALIAAAEGIQ